MFFCIKFTFTVFSNPFSKQRKVNLSVFSPTCKKFHALHFSPFLGNIKQLSYLDELLPCTEI